MRPQNRTNQKPTLVMTLDDLTKNWEPNAGMQTAIFAQMGHYLMFSGHHPPVACTARGGHILDGHLSLFRPVVLAALDCRVWAFCGEISRAVEPGELPDAIPGHQALDLPNDVDPRSVRRLPSAPICHRDYRPERGTGNGRAATSGA